MMSIWAALLEAFTARIRPDQFSSPDGLVDYPAHPNLNMISSIGPVVVVKRISSELYRDYVLSTF